MRYNVVVANHIFKGRTMPRGKPADLAEERFGRLVAKYPTEKRYQGAVIWFCECDCGNTHETTTRQLLSPVTPTRSCGCYNKDRLRETHTKHGMHDSPEYGIWETIVQRCHNPKAKSFQRYGAKGIFMCIRWKDSFADFLADVGPRPSPEHTIDRRSNASGYWCGRPDCSECGPLLREPNCHWATTREQSRNKDCNRWIEFAGFRLVARDWSTVLGIPYRTIYNRLNRGCKKHPLHDPRYPDWQSRLSAFVAENPTVCVTVGESQTT